MIALFSGTATPPTPASSTAGQGSAEGFGAAMLEQLGATAPAASAPAAAPSTPTPEELLAALAAGFATPGDAAPAAETAETPATDDPAPGTTDASVVASETITTPTAAPAPQPLVGAAAPAALPVTAAAAQPITPGVDAAVAPSTAGTAPAVAVAGASSAPAAAVLAPTVPRAASAAPAASTAGSASASTPAGAVPATPAGALDGAAPVQLPAARPAAPSAAPAVANGQPQASASPVVSTPATGAETSQPAPAPAVAGQPVGDTAVIAPKDAAAPIAFVPAATATASAPAAAPSSATPAAPVPLQAQVAAPVFTLAAAGPGEHVMTIDISPENLGPITVRAHVGAEGVRVELFAPTDLSREALRAILPDIRKDMAGAGLGGTLDLSSQNQPADRGDERGQGRREAGGETGVEPDAAASSARPWMLADPTATIDVMA